MKPGRGLSRSSEGARRWQERSRQRARERQQEREREARENGPTEPPQRRAGVRPGKGRRKLVVPRSTRIAALSRSAGVCVVCLRRERINPERLTTVALMRLVTRGTVRSAVQLHHVLPEEAFPQFAKLVDNLMGVCRECHDGHHGAPDGRIVREALPACSIDLAEREGLGWYIDRTYPVEA